MILDKNTLFTGTHTEQQRVEFDNFWLDEKAFHKYTIVVLEVLSRTCG